MVRVVPNMITVVALCMGTSGIRFALMERWEWAVISILIAGILDAMDGRLARLLGSVSDFGAELDSLSDFISFGISPAIVLYLFSLHQWKGWGWALSLFFATCMALRLARFNVQRLGMSQYVSGVSFFLGVPAPAGAFLSLVPLMLTFVHARLVVPTWIVALVMLGVALLTVSRIPTFSFKGIRLHQRFMPGALLFSVVIAASLINAPWETLCVLGGMYVGSIPASIILQKKMGRLQETPFHTTPGGSVIAFSPPSKKHSEMPK